ncbi:MAG: acetate--CoA ligase family protein [Bacillota bacterium]
MHEILKEAVVQRKNLLEPEAMQLFAAYNIPTPGFGLAKTKEEAASVAEAIGFPVVLKVVSPDILHKSDVGGVKVGLGDVGAVKKAYEEILDSVVQKVPEAEVAGVLVATQAPKGLECIIGMTKDPQFGPALMFGLGGIYVEVFKDISFRVLPLTQKDAEEMIAETKGYQLLKGIRGEEPKDINALVEVLLKVARMVEENPQIEEIDINPLVVYEKGVLALDARVIKG